MNCVTLLSSSLLLATTLASQYLRLNAIIDPLVPANIVRCVLHFVQNSSGGQRFCHREVPCNPQTKIVRSLSTLSRQVLRISWDIRSVLPIILFQNTSVNDCNTAFLLDCFFLRVELLLLANMCNARRQKLYWMKSVTCQSAI